MNYSEDIIILKSHVQSAMKDQTSWDTVVTLMESVCISFQKAKELNYVLLDELKACSSLFAIEDQTSETTLKFEIKQEVFEENQDPLVTEQEQDETTEVIDNDEYEVKEEYHPDEEEDENDPDYEEEQNDREVENEANVKTFSCD